MMLHILDVFRYIFNTVRACSNNTYKYKEFTITARHDSCDQDVINVESDRNNYVLDLVLEPAGISINDVNDYGLCVSPHSSERYVYISSRHNDEIVPLVDIRIRVKGMLTFYPYHQAEINDEWKIDEMIYPSYVEHYKDMAAALEELTINKTIDPRYAKRIWMLHSFGDNYMDQDFNVMGRIKERIGGTPVCILFMDNYANETSFEECKRVGFYNFIDEGAGQATLVVLKVDSIEIKDSICYIKGKYPDRIDDPMDAFFGTYAMFPVELVLYEELNIDRGDTNG